MGYNHQTGFNNGGLCLQNSLSLFGLGSVCYWDCQFYGWCLCLVLGLSVSWGLCLVLGLCVCGFVSM